MAKKRKLNSKNPKYRNGEIDSAPIVKKRIVLGHPAVSAVFYENDKPKK